MAMTSAGVTGTGENGDVTASIKTLEKTASGDELEVTTTGEYVNEISETGTGGGKSTGKGSKEPEAESEGSDKTSDVGANGIGGTEVCTATWGGL